MALRKAAGKTHQVGIRLDRVVAGKRRETRTGLVEKRAAGKPVAEERTDGLAIDPEHRVVERRGRPGGRQAL